MKEKKKITNTAILDYHIRQYKQQYRSTYSFIKFLKNFIRKDEKLQILDVGCGGGANIFWIKKSFENIKFNGIDIDKDALKIAEKNNPTSLFSHCSLDNISDQFKKEKNFDYVTAIHFILTAPYNPMDFLERVLPHCKKGIFLNSVFIDGFIEQKTIVTDIKNQNSWQYDFYSLKKIQNWCREKNLKISYEPFVIDIDLPEPKNKTLQTYTIKNQDGERIQISANMLFTWFNVFIEKND